VLFSATGKIIAEPLPFYTPIEWDGSPARELLTDNGHCIGKFDGKKFAEIPGTVPNPIQGSGLLMVADLLGDFRDELVLTRQGDQGMPEVIVVTATQPIEKAFIAPAENRDYRLWLARNIGGGYRSVYDQKLQSPEQSQPVKSR
jgi:hypothetical protein